METLVLSAASLYSLLKESVYRPRRVLPSPHTYHIQLNQRQLPDLGPTNSFVYLSKCYPLSQKLRIGQ